MTKLILVCASSSADYLACGQIVCAALSENGELPKQIVWMPKGTHQISAHSASGGVYQGSVVCDEAGARSIQASFERILASGRRVFLDEDHGDSAATAWVEGFFWDSNQGIIAKVAWTSLGEELLKGKVYHSFSPTFFVNKETNRVAKLWPGHAAGGLVNAPAFGAAMPALIAARLAGAESSANSAPDGSSGNQNKSTMNKELLIAILAALAVKHDPNATEEQLTALVKDNTSAIAAKAADNKELRENLAKFEQIQAAAAADKAKANQDELVLLRAREATRRKDDAKKAVDAAVARGALPTKDEAVQAKWRGLIEANPEHASLLDAMPSNAALQGRVTNPGIVVQAKDGLLECLKALDAVKDPIARGAIYAKEVSPLFKDANFSLGPILAANSLGTLSGELITQRSLSLLKRNFPALFAISTDYSSENAAFGQTVKTRLRTIPTVTPYSATTGYSTSDATATDVPITIDAHNAVQIKFGVNELASTTRDLFGEQVEGAHNAIGADLVDALLGLITVGNFNAAHTSTIALANFNRAAFTGIGKKLTGRKAPKVGRFALLNLDYYEKIGQDTSIVSLATYQQTQIITDNELPPIAKIKPYEVENFPTAGNLTGFAGTAAALALATRVPNDYTAAMPDVASNGVVQIVTNPDTGISVMLVKFIDHQLGASFWRLAYMRGQAVGIADCGERIISA